ncbi:MAG: DUF4595 domain-containing protein [Prevotellaceae bacterium]|jgi:hypothetical protein|nr:DUF4595 domain-containing protein [Prevotellaceae bacterium]
MKKLLVLLITAAGVCVSCEEERSRDCDIIAFAVDGTAWTIDGTTIAHTYPSGTAATPLTPVITVSEGATVSPASGTAQPLFSAAGVDYVVTAADGITTKTYTAKASIAGNPGDGRQVSRLTQVGNPNALDEFDRHDRVYDFEYDAQNRLTSLKSPLHDGDEDAEVRFVYADDRVTVTGISQSEDAPMICDDNGNCEGGESYVGTTTIEAQLNAGGYIASGVITTVWDGDHPNTSNTMTATYNADGYLTGLALGEGLSNVEHLALAWTDGNLTRVQEESSSGSYSYSVAQYTASPNKANLDLNWFVYSDPNINLREYTLFALAGLCGRRSQNMVAQTTEHFGSNSGTYVYTYTFDSDGYVTQWTKSGRSSTPTVYKVEYR